METEVPVDYLGLVWSKEDAVRAALRHTFIRVSQSNKRSTRRISGAEMIWSQPETEDEIYLVNFRISGKPKDVAIALNRAGYSEEQVEKALETALTKDTYQNVTKAIYEEELSKLKIFQEEEKMRKKQDEVDWDTLLNIAAKTKSSHVILREKGNTQRGVGRGKTFLEQFERVRTSEGKVVDVSEMRPDSKGIKVRNKPSSERSRLVVLDTIPVVSNNEKQFLRALEILKGAEEFESDTEYQKAVNLVRAKFAKKKR
jgi:hypothetical protein